MTIDEFLDIVASIKDSFRWTLDNGCIRGHPVKPDSLAISFCWFCPINALVYKKFNRAFNDTVDQTLEAGTYLGLTEDDSHVIMNSADNLSFKSTFSLDLRQKLLNKLSLDKTGF